MREGLEELILLAARDANAWRDREKESEKGVRGRGSETERE